MAASNKVVKMSAEAQRQHAPPGSCCLPGTHLQIINCGRRCQSVLSGYTVYIQSSGRLLYTEQGDNNGLGSGENLVVMKFRQIEQTSKTTVPFSPCVDRLLRTCWPLFEESVGEKIKWQQIEIGNDHKDKKKTTTRKWKMSTTQLQRQEDKINTDFVAVFSSLVSSYIKGAAACRWQIRCDILAQWIVLLSHIR